MATMSTKPTTNVVSNRPHQAIGLETKLKVAMDYKGGQSVMVIAHHSGISHSMILKHKNKVMKLLENLLH